MAPTIPSATTELDYPIYAVDFDPQDANRLVVGGGGGAGRSGVGNKITALDTSHQGQVRVAGEIELSSEEDSVMSLAVGPHRGKTCHVFAGVNSSANELIKGTNQHLRIFSLQPSRAKSMHSSSTSPTTPTKPRAFPETQIAEVSRTALFTRVDANMYQRLLRVSGPIGAAASALGKEPQIVVFDVAVPRPKLRGVLELAKEAEALDIVQTGAKEFQLAYCDRCDLYTVQIGSKTKGEARLVFSMPDDHGERPQFRSIRYLTPEFILAVANLPKRNTGALIYGLRMPSSSGHEKARLAVTARIPGNLSATALTVTNLAQPPTPLDPVGNTQFAIAVAGNNSSISLYTLEHRISPALNLVSRLHPFHTLRSVHGEDQISGLAFSTFTTPKTHIRAQHIKLASTSLQKTVFVHNIPLKKYIDKSEPRSRRGPARPARYVVAMPSRGPSAQPVMVSLAVVVLILALAAQSVKEMYGVGRPLIFAQPFLPSWHGSLRSPDFQPDYFAENKLVSSLAGDRVLKAGKRLVLLDYPAPAQGVTTPATTPATDQLKKYHVDVHDSDAHGNARTWDQLRADEKRIWKERLREAGAWTQSMGESVFKGVLFGELAGMVGRAVGG